MHNPAGVSPAQNSCGHLAARGLLYFLNCNQCHTNFSEGRDVLFYFRSVKQKQTIAVNLRALKRHLTEPYSVLIVWESTVLAQLAYWANSLWHNNDPWVAMRYHPTVILSILSDFKILDLAADKDQIDCYGAPIENGAFVWQCHCSNNQVASYWGEISFWKFAIKTGIADCYKQDKALILHLSCERMKSKTWKFWIEIGKWKWLLNKEIRSDE